MTNENHISKANHVLIVLGSNDDPSSELSYLIDHFCGTVYADFPESDLLEGKRVFVCGDCSGLNLADYTPIYVIRELSTNDEGLDGESIQVIGLGEVPVVVHHAGVYFRHLFTGENYFNRIVSEHEFQELTESNKQSKALRKGIYLSNVIREETAEREEQLRFNLLRCSSNLTGPTDNFRVTDREVMTTLNEAASRVFTHETQLNHVLAQVYENRKKAEGRKKELKAKIKAHSDKTKDMPMEGLIAFCTFYDPSGFDHLKQSSTDRFDWCYNGGTSGLTRLYFKLKNNIDDPNLVSEFTVTLYPDSAFIIPLSTNRLYTHEIRPSTLNIDFIPVRMGYVARCSNLEGLHVNGSTFIEENGELIPLQEMTPETMSSLRSSYRQENITDDQVEYGKVLFSMNSGDYKKPIY